MNFGEILKKTRQEKNISATALAIAIGVDRKTIYRWENGLATPRFYDDIMNLAKTLSVPVDIFFDSDSLCYKVELNTKEIMVLKNKVSSLEHKLKGLGIID